MKGRLFIFTTVTSITIPGSFRQELPLMLKLGLHLPYVYASYVVQFCLKLKICIGMLHPSAAAVPYPA